MKKRSAALIIALLIITVASGIVLGVGRDVVAATFTTNRYSDNFLANSLAWAGIEDGLWRLKTHSNDAGSVSAYLPVFDALFNNVVRRNVSRGDDRVFPIDYNKSVINNNPPGNCSPPANCANWVLSDQYYDFRVSGSDDLNIDTDTGGFSVRGVNLYKDAASPVVYSVLDKGDYYQVTDTEALPGVGAFRFFDMRNYTGNNDIAFTDDHQRIAFVYELDPLTNLVGAGKNISINFFVKYRSEDSCTVDGAGNCNPAAPNGKNDNLECKVNTSPAPGVTRGVLDPTTGIPPNFYYNFYSTVGSQITATNNPRQFAIYVPASCRSDAGHYMSTHLIDYLGAKFYFNGGATGKIYYGFRTSSSPPTWHPNQDSYIGTGVTKILSNGIYNNIRSQIEIWAYQPLKLGTNISDSNRFEAQCNGGASNGNPNLNLCQIKVFRDTKNPGGLGG